MKVIDLLNKIANGEEVPEEIIFHDQIYYYHKGYDFDYAYTIDKGGFLLENNSLFQFSSYKNNFWNDNSMIEFLNDEVEIIDEKEMCHKCHKYPAEYNQTWCEFCLGISKEEKKIPEKIDNSYYHLGQDQQNQLFKNTINEIIDYLDYLKSKGDE